MAKFSDSNTLVKNVLRTLKLYWRISPSYLVQYLLLLILQVTASLSSIYFGSRVIGELARSIGTHHAGSVYRFLAYSALTLLAERFAWRWLNLTERKAWTKWYTYIILAYNGAMASLDIPQHHDNKFNKMVNKLQNQYQYTPPNFANSILQFIHSSIRLLSGLVLMLSFAPLLVPIMILSLVPMAVTEWRISKLQWSLWNEDGDYNMLAWRTTNYLQDKNKLLETKLFGTTKHLKAMLNKLYGDFYGRQLSNIIKMKYYALASLLTEASVIVGSQAWLISKAIAGRLTLASYSFYSGVILQFNSSLSLVVSSLTFINDNNHYMRDFYMLLDMKPLLPHPTSPTILSKDRVPTIVLDNVSFKYPESENWALRNVSLTISVGEKIAFVGENGAGKTTLIKLLLRFYDPTEGAIYIDDIDLKTIDLPSYYFHVGALFQNFNDYPYSVRDNIALGRVENFGDTDGVIKAAQMSGADKFIDKYPKKYDQVLEISFKDGIEPSGGQWQRIALARALFRDAGILILDEPTAAVDAKSEYAIFKTLEEHSAGRTTIVISHRFSTVRTSNKIYVIANSQIVESGSHQELIKHKNGLYKEMFDKQAEGYK